MISRRGLLGGAVATAATAFVAPESAQARSISAHQWDVIVYGCTFSGVIAAITAARAGVRTLLVRGSDAFGGTMTNGLVGADTRVGETGGLMSEYFHRVAAHAGRYGFLTTAAPIQNLHVLIEMAYESGMTIAPGLLVGVEKTGKKIMAIRLSTGEVARLSTWGMLLDGTMTGDALMAVSTHWTVGRESHARYGESLAGFGTTRRIRIMSPYDDHGALLPGVLPHPAPPSGAPISASSPTTTSRRWRATTTRTRSPSRRRRTMTRCAMRSIYAPV